MRAESRASPTTRPARGSSRPASSTGRQSSGMPAPACCARPMRSAISTSRAAAGRGVR